MANARSLLREYLEVLLITLIFAIFARTYTVQAFKIPTGSMEENLLIGDHILVNKFVYGPSLSALEAAVLPTHKVRRGDVVVFKFPEDPERDFIKRCIGLPGDEIEIVDKTLFVNGQKVEDRGYTYRLDPRSYPRSVFLHDSYRDRDNFGPTTVPQGHYFFMGDNRDNSNDSRFWGSVPGEFIKGRAFLIYWSFEDGRESADWPGYQGRAKQLANVFLRFFTNTRWERSFNIVK
jgi:signal peptidase I